LRVSAATAIALLAALSFAIEIASIGAHPMAAFFLPFGRMWELAAGGMLAVAWGKFSMRAPVADLVSVAGFAAIIGAALLLQEGQDFPGWRAAIPVGGAAAVIAAGSNAWVNQSILQRSWLVGLGRISYPLYLWHWVLLSYSTVLVGGPPFWASRLCLLALSLVASWITYFFVERWFRNGRRANVKAVGLCVAMLAVIAVAFGVRARPAAHRTQPTAPQATASARCASAEYHQLDFWIGDWDAYDVDDPKQAARLKVTPVVGGWGTANWMTPWAEKAGSPALRADVLQVRALTGIVGSLLGG